MPLIENTPKVSEKEYLDLEEKSVDKHEFHNGDLFAMAGASKTHCKISANIITELNIFHKDKRCEVYGSDMKVFIEDKKHKSTHYVYPDVLISCEEKDIETSGNVIFYPKVIIEVLSPSTEGYDRGDKFELYRQLRSLRDYILVNQDKKKVDVFSRKSENTPFWTISTYDEEDKIVKLSSIGFECNIESIYDKVRFDSKQV